MAHGATGAGAPPAVTGTQGILGRVAAYLELVKFSHTVFVLPFALTGAVLAARGLPDGRTLAWVVAAMGGPRTGAMAVNRIADRHLDAENPRTANRQLPQGRLRVAEAAALAAAGFALFLLAAWMLNPLRGLLAPPAIAVVAAGWLGAAGLLAYEHRLVYRHGLARLDVAFFTVNGTLSVGLFLFTLGDLLWGR